MGKIIGFTLVALVILAGGGLWYWNTHKKKIIRNELEKAISEKSHGLYKVDYADLDLDELSGNLSISSFNITYDSSKYALLKTEDKEPYLLFNISIPQLQVTGVKTDRALLQKEITGKHLIISNPVIEITYTNSGKDSSRTVPDQAIYRQILGKLEFIKLDTVVISNAEIITKSIKTGRISVHFLNTTITMLDVAVDSVANADTTRLLFAKEINLDCQNFTWQSKNKLYNYEGDSIAFRSASSNVSIKNFLIKPQAAENAFARQFPVQTDRFDLAIHNISLKNVEYAGLTDDLIKADSLVIGSGTFKIYRDRNRPADKKSKVGNYPHQLIQKMPIKLDIKKAIVSNAYLEYKEKSPITHQPGRVQLWNSSVYITNITNRKEAIADNNLMVVDMRSRLLNKIPISAKWTFYLGNPDGKFRVEGQTGQGDAQSLNALTVPMGPVEIKSGHIQSLTFDFTGNDYSADGTLKLLYDDLHVALLKKDDDSVHFKRRKAISLLANMKIKNKNPEKGDPPRVINVNYKREPSASIFKLVWKTLLTGMQETIGIK